MLDKAKIAELEALLAQHAEPWEVAGQYVRTEYNGHGGFVVANCADAITGAADTAMFIAEMRMALPALLRLARAVVDAPRGEVVLVAASGTIGRLETVIESGRSLPNGQTVILLRADAADTTAGEGGNG